MDKTGIEWTDSTWNPVRGCSLVSDGCKNCYAMHVANRFSGDGQPYAGLINRTTQGPKWSGKITLVDSMLNQPLHWTKPRKIFVNSMSDLFHEGVPDWFIDRVFVVMALAHQHTFQILTKRPDRMHDYIKAFDWKRAIVSCIDEHDGVSVIERNSQADLEGQLTDRMYGTKSKRNVWPLPNVWLGISAENQATFDDRVMHLLKTPAAIRWVSMEPLLGPIDMTSAYLNCQNLQDAMMDPETGAYECCGNCDHTGIGDKMGIDWVVAGGESGHGARPMHPAWVRSIRDQCAAAGVPFLLKQWGEWHTKAYNLSTGEAVFRQFESYEQWVSKGSSWVNGGICLDTNGVHLKIGGDMARARDTGTFPVIIMHKVGKKVSGRLLDGVVHDGYPVNVAAREVSAA